MSLGARGVVLKDYLENFREGVKVITRGDLNARVGDMARNRVTGVTVLSA